MQTSTLPKPKNQSALALLLLIEKGNKGVTMKDACKVLFYKFQTRLGELERSTDATGLPRSRKLKIRRLKVEQKNRFGHNMTFINYKSLAPMSYLINLYKKINREGLPCAR